MQRILLQRKYILIKLLIIKRQQAQVMKSRSKRTWVRKIYQERYLKGEFASLVRDLKIHDETYFFRYFRMSPTIYENLLSWVAPFITKQTTKFRAPISAAERLCVTLRYLVTGDAQSTIAAIYRISPSSVANIISDTSTAIWETFSEKGYLKYPENEQKWRFIAQEFEEKWNFPNAIGAIDGKHVVIQAPHSSGSSYFNYKKTHSIVLMGIWNAR